MSPSIPVSNRFSGKTVLITGGRSGIGESIAHRFAAEGANVFTAQRNPSEVFQTIVADLSQPDAPNAVIDAMMEKSDRLDVLVNNAGIMTEATLDNLSIEEWNRHLAVNLTAPFLLIKAALPALIASKGNIVNIGSIEGLGANPGHAAYCASKAGLHGLTRAVAIDHGKDGVRCNAIAPGWIDTELNQTFIDSMPSPGEFRAKIGGIHPLKRTGKTEEVASVAAFLASSDASFITGQVYTVDGGRMSKLSLPE
ncbi:MAG: SDR family NAD(P)-dependent oxidoreductase [Planctomycetota bacterium]